MQAERRRADLERLHVTELSARQIDRIAHDGKAEMPEMNADLVGPAGEWTRLQQRGAVGLALEHTKLGARRQAAALIDFA